MKPLFKRKGFCVDEDDFNSLNAFTKDLPLGMFEIFQSGVRYSNSRISVEVPTNKIIKATVINEKSYKVYKYILLVPVLLILSAYFIYGPVSIKNTFMVTFAISLFVVLIYPTLYKRKWLKLEYKEDGSKNVDKVAYFSFDWRAQYFLVSWGRQRDTHMWFINRGDCKNVVNIIKNVREKVKSSEAT